MSTRTITVTAGGDSQTDYQAGFGVRPSDTWVPQLAKYLGAKLGRTVHGRGFGISGNTSTQLLARIDVLQMHETPDIALLNIGVNDPGSAISQAQTQANLQAMIKALKHGANGAGAGLAGGVTVADQTALPATGLPGQRYVVLADTSTTGGADAWVPGAAARITGTLSGSPQSVWECTYTGQAGERGWRRVATVATAPTVCPRILVVSTNYLNFTTGGDTLSTSYAAYAPVRAAQQAAVAAENVQIGGVDTVLYVDLYGFLRSRIVAGTDPDFSAVAYDQTKSWHYTLNNQHKSAYGHSLDAQAILATIPTAWTTALQAL